MRTSTVVGLGLAALALVAAGCEATPLDSAGSRAPDARDDVSMAADDGTAWDTSTADAADLAPPADPLQGVLAFVDLVGADGRPCGETDRCALVREPLDVVDLRVRLTENGRPVPMAMVRFTIERPDETVARLSPSSGVAVTDDAGQAGVHLRLESVASAWESAWESAVRVEALDRPRPVAPLFFDIAVACPCPPALRVEASYTGRRSIEAVEWFLFRRPSDPPRPGRAGADGFACDDLLPIVLRADEASLPNALARRELPIGALFVTDAAVFPDLETEGEGLVTVLAIGRDGDDAVAVGCDDASGHMRIGETTSFALELRDLPSRWAGTYAVETSLPLRESLPPCPRGVLEQELDFVVNAARASLGLLCALESESAATLCAVLFDGAGGLTGSGEAFLALLRPLPITIGDGAEGPLTADVLRPLFDEMTVLGAWTFADEPDESGALRGESTWTTLRYRWPLEEATGDLPLIARSGADVASAFVGRVEGMGPSSEGRSGLTIDPHRLDLGLGHLVHLLVAQVLLPRLTGEGEPRITNHADFLRMVLAGREGLAEEAAGGPTCAARFAARAAAEVPMLTPALVEAGLTALVNEGGALLDARLLALDPEGGEALVLGTGAPCPAEGDPRAPTFGTAAAPCTLDAQLVVVCPDAMTVHLVAPFTARHE